jgi:hypothetical protein
MSYAKYAKYAIIGLAPLVLIYGVWTSLQQGRSPLPDSYTFVDVETGDVVYLKRNEIRFIPEKNDRNDLQTLFPVSVNHDGQYAVEDRYHNDVRKLAEQIPLKINAEPFLVDMK